MNPSSPGCAGYGSETAWSNSGGGISQVFARPAFQTGCGVPPGSQRLVPDVALEADPSPGNYVLEGGLWYSVGGTSDAAPQWAGFFAELSQKVGGTALGNPGALLYGRCGTAAFHDITSGFNGTYSAGPGYDLVTGLGTIEAKNFLALTAPSTTTTTTPVTTTTSTVPSLVRCGDVNGDGAVNIGDALIVAQFDVGIRQCGQLTHPEVCDVNRDGACNIGDALRIGQCDVGQISCTFSCNSFTCP